MQDEYLWVLIYALHSLSIVVDRRELCPRQNGRWERSAPILSLSLSFLDTLTHTHTLSSLTIFFSRSSLAFYNTQHNLSLFLSLSCPFFSIYVYLEDRKVQCPGPNRRWYRSGPKLFISLCCTNTLSLTTHNTLSLSHYLSVTHKKISLSLSLSSALFFSLYVYLVDRKVQYPGPNRRWYRSAPARAPRRAGICSRLQKIIFSPMLLSKKNI